MDYALVIVIGLLGGFAVGIQSPFAGAIGARLGSASSSLIVHVSGAIFSVILLWWRGGEKMREWQTLPWYLFFAGIFGVVLYQTINVTLPRLGTTMTAALIIVGQLVMGLVVDHFGWLGVTERPIDATRIIGVGVLLLGAYLIAK